MNMTPFTIWGEVQNLHVIISASVSTSSLMSNMADLHCKSRLVAGGHMTAPPKDSIHSGVVTLRSLRLYMHVSWGAQWPGC
jgi:hypothetical protein